MVHDALSVQDLQSIDPDVLLEEAIKDDTVLRLVQDAVEIGRSRVSEWRGTVDGDDVATLDPQAPTNEVVVALAREGFSPNWLLSYEYGSEVANLVRFHYDPDLYPERPFRQLHVRLFDDGTLEAHEEPSALMHKGPHIREETFDREAGTAAVRTILEDAGVDVEVLEED